MIRDQTGKVAAARLTALQECEDRRIRGKVEQSLDCRTDESVRAAVARAEGKLDATIGKRCGGKDKTCGGDDTDEPLDPIGWDVGTCPDLEGTGCINAIDDCGGVATCVSCAAGAPVERLVESLLGTFVLPSRGDKALNRCQRTIGREATQLFASQNDALAACWHAAAEGKPGFGEPCPQGDESGATSDRLRDAETRLAKKVCKACGGGDRACGSGDDLSPGAIGFLATCPDVTVPDGPACEGAVTTLPDLVDCIQCLTRFKGACLDALAVPWGTALPDECNGTSSASCSDGIVDPGEECDGSGCGAGEICQLDCTCVRVPACGDGFVDPGEQCDGTGCSPGETCQPDCTCMRVPACGDGVVDPGEECDQTVCAPGETCEPDCTCAIVAACGNGVVDPGEECDATQCPGDEECLADCTCQPTSPCGNGTIDPGEECDGSDCPAGELCQPDCTCIVVAGCGNGVLDPGEECDGPGCPDGEECFADCTCSVTPTCGNGVVEPGEECDASFCPGGGECSEECTCLHT